MTELDEIDRQILRNLQDEGRAAYNEIGDKLGITGNTVKRRIDEMRERDIIRKFTVLTNPTELDYLTVTFGLTVEAGLTEEIADHLSELECIYKVWMLSGTHNVIFDARFRDTEHFQQFVHEVLHNIEGVTHHESSIVTKTVKEEGSVILPTEEPVQSLPTNAGETD